MVFPSFLMQTDMQSWEEQSQGAIYTVEYACRWEEASAHILHSQSPTVMTVNVLIDLVGFCSAVKSMTNSSMLFKNIDSLLRQAISMKEQISSSQGRR